MKIITAGSKYMDIDAYAGCIAYAELQNAQGHKAIAVSTAPLNESIPATVRSWNAPLQTTYTPATEDTFTLIDVSEPDQFSKIVDPDRIDEVIDHHLGTEQYWRERIGDGADIEFIGAACTQVYERWKSSGLLDRMSVVSARLLVCGILDNTLNFGAKVTTQRDIDAHQALLAQAALPSDWTAQYFAECQQGILSDVATGLRNDTKTIVFHTYTGGPLCVGQMVVWDGSRILAEHMATIRGTLASMQPEWFLNLVSIEEGKSYFMSDNEDVQNWLSALLGVKFDGAVAQADRLWLRKEIIKQDLEKHDLSPLL